MYGLWVPSALTHPTAKQHASIQGSANNSTTDASAHAHSPKSFLSFCSSFFCCFFPALSFISSPEKLTTHTGLPGIGSVRAPPPLPFVHMYARIYVSSTIICTKLEHKLVSSTQHRHTLWVGIFFFVCFPTYNAHAHNREGAHKQPARIRTKYMH